MPWMSTAGLDSREFGHADRLPLLAAELNVGVPVSEWTSCQLQPRPLLRAMLGLQMALAASPLELASKTSPLHLAGGPPPEVALRAR